MKKRENEKKKKLPKLKIQWKRKMEGTSLNIEQKVRDGTYRRKIKRLEDSP